MTKQPNKKLANEWFKKADDDYKSAKVVVEEGGYYGTTCFLAQQIAEKYFKGYLVFIGAEVPKIHDLIKLLNECKKHQKSFEILGEDAIMLNDYYIETRYPLDTPVNYAKKEAVSALKIVDRIKTFVLSVID